MGGDKGAADNDAVRHSAEDGLLKHLLRPFSADIQIQQGQAVTLPAQLLAGPADNIEHMGVLIGQTLVKPVGVQHVFAGPPGQIGGRGIGSVVELFHYLQHPLPGGGRHMNPAVDYLADGGDGYARLTGDILDGGCHGNSPFSFFDKTLSEFV